MKRSTSLIAATLLCAASPMARAQIIINTGLYNVNSDIPDGSLSGLSDTRTIAQSTGPIIDVTVNLSISGLGYGANNGDFYAYLSHDSGIAVLLNRPGLRSGSTIGYDDSGLNSVTFSDSASNGDVHNYRLQLFGNQTTSIGVTPSPLSGTWQPDGRSVSPQSSGATFDSASRDQTLNSFQNMNALGNWTLFVADLSGGAQGRLDSWSMTITAVPEPRATALAMGTALLAFTLIRRRFFRSQ